MNFILVTFELSYLWIHKTIKQKLSQNLLTVLILPGSRNGQEITESTVEERYEVSVDGKELVIFDAEIDDTARFTCKAENIAGQTEKNFDLDVYSKFIDKIHRRSNNETLVYQPKQVVFSEETITDENFFEHIKLCCSWNSVIRKLLIHVSNLWPYK